MDTYFKLIEVNVDSCKIGFLKFLLEGYDGMTILSTLDRLKGTISIRYASTFEAQLFVVLEQFTVTS